MENPLFTAILFCTMIACYTGAVMNAMLGLHPMAAVSPLIVGIIFTLLWRISSIWGVNRSLVHFASLCILCFFYVLWLYNGGSKGAMQPFFIIGLFIFFIFTKGASRVLFLIAYSISVLILLYAEYRFPWLIKGYVAEEERLIDIAYAMVNCQVFFGIILLIMDQRYFCVYRKLDEEKKASETRFSQTADMLPVVICETDTRGRIVYLNRVGMRLLFGTQRPLNESRTVLDFIHGDDRQRAAKMFSVGAEGGRPGFDEYRFCSVTGAMLTLLTHTEALISNSGFIGFRSCMIDVTERKNIEEQFSQARKMETLGFLAGGVAHDFNNILAGILGYAQLIQKANTAQPDGFINSLLDKRISAIIKTSQRAADLITKLLAFSRQGTYEIKPCNMHDCIQEVIDILLHSIDKRIKIRRHLGSANPWVAGDPSLLQSALLNLAINARDAMPEGGTMVFSTSTVRSDEFTEKRLPLQHCPGRGNYLSVAVADTGIGMDDSVKAHLFEPFFTTKEPGKGTGMGLASVFGTITRHEGFIDVVSEPKRGTTVTVYLPENKAGAKEPCEEIMYARTIASKGHVLIVDDEEIICAFVKELLEENGYRVTVYTNPVRALQWYCEHYKAVDCVIIDINMPDMNGIECFSAMIAVNPLVRGIVSTGFVRENYGDLKSIPGVVTVLQKPFTDQELSKAIGQVMQVEIDR
ncbi:MAG: response regulator [Chitinivibrionales bacterium]|nr:response regulator [Chitinivibrionales bacterium]